MKLRQTGQVLDFVWRGLSTATRDMRKFTPETKELVSCSALADAFTATQEPSILALCLQGSKLCCANWRIGECGFRDGPRPREVLDVGSPCPQVRCYLVRGCGIASKRVTGRRHDLDDTVV